MTDTAANVDPEEIAKFERQASRWWDPEGEFKPLHEINPLRMGFIEDFMPLGGMQVVDVGCGGGILAEAMAARGAKVTGIDMAAAALSVAKLHGLESGIQVDYRCIDAETFAEQHPASFDAVTCMELLEHVPDPASTIRACAQLVRPGGWVFLSTLNRNPKSYLLAIIGAEYLLRLLPRGTHDYARFIRPSELESWVRQAGLRVTALNGLQYNPLSRRYSLGANLDVNYLVACRAGDDA